MTTNPASSIRIGDLIVPERIELRLMSKAWDGVLTELVGRMPELANQPEARHQLLQALVERERLCSTGVGEGVAIPHSRAPVPGLVEKPLIVFGRHAEGIAFNAVDGQPVRIFFLLVSAGMSQHLQLLARLSRLLRQGQLRQELMAAETPAQAVERVREAEMLLR